MTPALPHQPYVEFLYTCAQSEIIFSFSNENENEKQVIVISLPGEKNVQYLEQLQNLAEFAIEMDQVTQGRDHLFIIHDKSGLKYFHGYTFVNAYLIEMDESLDMWMRDFPPTMPNQQIQFTYNPQYLSDVQAEKDSLAFEKFARMVGLSKTLTHSKLVLEGGNIVENGCDKAITTARALDDNPGEKDFIAELEYTIKRTVAVLPDPGDTTGHADGLVSFVERDVLLISEFDDADGKYFYKAMKRAVHAVFPNLFIAPLPCYIKKSTSHGFSAAEGSYANSLVTNNAVYMPYFSRHESNEKARKVFQKYTYKDVVPVIAAGKVNVLGGSVRCMTWQIDKDHSVAKALFKYVENKRKRSLI